MPPQFPGVRVPAVPDRDLLRSESKRKHSASTREMSGLGNTNILTNTSPLSADVKLHTSKLLCPP